jgi:WhiB family transcriptional regulator, redox-sensing transcriptional regulator
MTDAYVPLTGPPTWHHAACRGEDPELWFSSEPLDVKAAIDICRRCEHTDECITFAVETDTTYGIWGGLTPEQRSPVRRGKAGRTYSKAERWRRRQRLDDAITGWI